MRIAIVYSTPSKRARETEYSETDSDSKIIAQTVQRGLDIKGYETELIEISEDNMPKILDIRAECIFNLIEWCGRDIELSVRAFEYFAQLGVPVTGSSSELFVLTGDKARLKTRLLELGLPTPQAQTFVTGEEKIEISCFPVIVKPSLEHCSTGLTKEAIAHDEVELKMIIRRQIKDFEQPALAEEFIMGRELLVYLIEINGKVQVLPIEEVVFSGGDPLSFQTYQSKWEVNHPDYQNSKVVVATLTESEKNLIEKVCCDTFEKMGFGGYARFDVRLRGGVPYLLETNANPSVYDAEGELEDPNDEVIPGIRFCDYLEAIVVAARKV